MVAMFWDFGSIHMIVTDGRTVSAQNTEGDHVQTNSRAVRKAEASVAAYDDRPR